MRTLCARPLIGALLPVVLLAPCVVAQSAPDPVASCFEGTTDPELDAFYCTVAIEDWGLDGTNLATLLVKRGRALTLTRRLSEAQADFARALALNPLSAAAHNERGLAYHDAGDYAAAMADFDAALALSPHAFEIWRNRGTTRLLQGDMASAAADFAKALALNPIDRTSQVLRGLALYVEGDAAGAAAHFERPFVARYGYRFMTLWRYLAARQLGGDPREVLREEREDLTDGEWSAALLDYYLDVIDEAVVLAEAEAQPSMFRPTRTAEAHLFIAERAGLDGDEAKARRHLEAALAAGGDQSVEWAIAKATLARLAR